MKFYPILLLSILALSCKPEATDLKFLGKPSKTNKLNGNWVLTNQSLFSDNLKFYNISLPDTVISYAETFKIKDSLVEYELIVNNGWVCGNGQLYFDTITYEVFDNKILLNLKGGKSISHSFDYQGVYSFENKKDTLYLALDTILKNEKIYLRDL